ncbi:MAG: hypothetical protein ACO1NZ_02710 [Adhaeribacter sp.]
MAKKTCFSLPGLLYFSVPALALKSPARRAFDLKKSFCLKNAGFVNILFRRRKHFDPLLLQGLATLVIQKKVEKAGLQVSENNPAAPGSGSGSQAALAADLHRVAILEKYLF